MVVLSSEKTEEKEKEKEKEEEKTEKVGLSNFSEIILIALNKTIIIKAYLYLFEKQLRTSWMACICLPTALLLYPVCKNAWFVLDFCTWNILGSMDNWFLPSFLLYWLH